MQPVARRAYFDPVSEVEQDTLMTQTRKSRGLSLEQVATSVGTDQANLWRLEQGKQVPKRELARKIFEFYGGAVPLAAIYDPQFYQQRDARA